jgi:hypothetical protein
MGGGWKMAVVVAAVQHPWKKESKKFCVREEDSSSRGLRLARLEQVVPSINKHIYMHVCIY